MPTEDAGCIQRCGVTIVSIVQKAMHSRIGGGSSAKDKTSCGHGAAALAELGGGQTEPLLRYLQVDSARVAFRLSDARDSYSPFAFRRWSEAIKKCDRRRSQTTRFPIRACFEHEGDLSALRRSPIPCHAS